jgi:hypothetical protein
MSILYYLSPNRKTVAVVLNEESAYAITIRTAGNSIPSSAADFRRAKDSIEIKPSTLLATNT